MSRNNIGIIGLGFVGGAMKVSFEKRNIPVKYYDKYKEVGDIDSLTCCKIIFMCLPTPFIENAMFDKSAIYENLDLLENKKYSGLVVIKSTVEPGTIKNLSKEYSFDICHNPEFLTARTAKEDFENQKHIVLGKSKDSDLFNDLVLFYKRNYKDAKISICSSCESESMKIFCNSFYASKVMIFNEFYFLCKKLNINFEIVKELMLENSWINPMHTNVPGPDGMFGYGGACFPKDVGALLEFMKRNDLYCKILMSVSEENGIIRGKEK